MNFLLLWTIRSDVISVDFKYSCLIQLYEIISTFNHTYS